jgi:hypothetical protein
MYQITRIIHMEVLEAILAEGLSSCNRDVQKRLSDDGRQLLIYVVAGAHCW